MILTMSDWIMSMDKLSKKRRWINWFSLNPKPADSASLEELATRLHTNKIEDIRRVISSRLPTLDYVEVSYKEFNSENICLMNFFEKYSYPMVRLIPLNKELRRIPKRVSSYEEAKKFIAKVPRRHRKNYTILLSNFVLSNQSAIIISNDKQVRIEVGNCSLPELSRGSYGLDNAIISCQIDLTKVGHITDKMSWGEIKDEREILKVLRSIELTRDSFNPHYMKGYFEVVISEGRPIFVDYKVNEIYIK